MVWYNINKMESNAIIQSEENYKYQIQKQERDQKYKQLLKLNQNTANRDQQAQKIEINNEIKVII